MKLLLLTALCILSVLATSPSRKDDCINLGLSDIDKDTTYLNGRCYVLNYVAASVGWTAASTMCNDLPNLSGGLAMWISKAMFEWIEWQYNNAEEWIWVGAYSTKGDVGPNIFAANKTDFRFGQSTARTMADSWSTLSSGEGVIVKAPNDTFYDHQNYGLVGTKWPNYGWGDDLASAVYWSFLCQYENPTTAYTSRPIAKLDSKLIIENMSSVTHAKCNSVCHTHPLCNSYAHNEVTQDCETYLVGPDDLGGYFETSWIQPGATDWKLFVRS